MKKISIIVPIYGVEKYIGQCADSVLSQTYPETEFIFVNDGTKDASMQILRQLIEDKFSHLKERIILLDQENAGVSAARRNGLEASSGDYILFCDSDDWIEPDTASRLMESAEKSGDDIIYFDLYKEYGNRTRLCRERDYSLAEKDSLIRNLFNYRTRAYLVTKCFSRRLFKEHEIFFSPYQMHDDIYMSVQLFWYARSYSHLACPLYHYRLSNPFSASSADHAGRRLQSSLNMMDLYSHFSEHVEKSPVAPIFGDIFVTTGWNSIVHKLNLFSTFPALAAGIRKAPFNLHSRLSLPAQLIIKIYALFK